MRVGIIGLGYVGLTLAVAVSVKEIDVYGVETTDGQKNWRHEIHIITTTLP